MYSNKTRHIPPANCKFLLSVLELYTAIHKPEVYKPVYKKKKIMQKLYKFTYMIIS